MDITKLAAQLLSDQFGGKASAENASSALSELAGDGKGGIDLGDIVGKMTSSGGLGSIVQSWLGDGDNDDIEPSQLTEMFDGEKISKFAQALGVSQDDAASGLSQLLPRLIDKSSSGGSLLDSVGGIGGAMNMAKGLFK